MKQLLLILCKVIIWGEVFSQEINQGCIDSAIIHDWPVLGRIIVSNDGKYVAYSINNQPVGSTTFVVQSADKNWRKEFIGCSAGIFVDNSKKVLVKSNDTLLFLSLGTNIIYSISNVNSYQISQSGADEWLAYQKMGQKKELVLLNLVTLKEQHYSNVSNYSFAPRGSGLLLSHKKVNDSGLNVLLELIQLPEQTANPVWTPDSNFNSWPEVQLYSFDGQGKQLAFVVNGGGEKNSIWYYKIGMKTAVMRVNSQARGIDSGFVIKNSSPVFSKNGLYLFFELARAKAASEKKVGDVDVWDYRHTSPHFNQGGNSSELFVAMMNTETNEVVRLLQKNEKIKEYSSDGNYIIIYDKASIQEKWLDNYDQKAYYLISLKDASRKLIATSKSVFDFINFSPTGKYVVYFDTRRKQYFSYDIANNMTQSISGGIPTRIDNEDKSNADTSNIPVGIGAWTEKDKSVIIYDNYDMWEIDPIGIKPPFNITNSFGSSHGIKFRLTHDEINNLVVKKSEPLLITAFNVNNKYNGFFSKRLGKKGDPELLTLEPCVYQHIPSQLPSFNKLTTTMRPIKARDQNVWIVERMTARESPNYFLTKDFKTFTALTNVQPQEKCDWLTSELVSWRQFDGTISQGVLYKSNNFDSTKKYPIIFNYYEKSSHRLFEFPKPGFTKNNINIPWFVSRGYLVFTPDIHYSFANKSGKIVGDHVYNSVVSAAKYLSKRAWIDSNRMALQGHSFGGFETNYLITQTNLFAAAAEVAGTSDFISSYLSLAGGMTNPNYIRQHLAEYEQGRMGMALWDMKELYLKSSPILMADQISTPLLIMHNKNDVAVPWAQGVEMFLALRRLEKRVWMLQYDKGGHSISGMDAWDYTMRLTQFFDHYLKEAPTPVWMSKKMDSSMDEFDVSLELDTAGACGDSCDVCNRRNASNGKNLR